MSMRFEWFSAEYTTASHVGPGCDVRDGQPSGGENYGEWTVDADRHALVFGGDEAAVLTGTPDELRGLLQRALAALDAAEPALPDLPTPADEQDEVEATCPHVYTEEEVAQLQEAEDQFIARMRQTKPDYTPSPSAKPRVPEVGSVCGAELILWDKDPVRRYLYTQGGQWIAGPSKGADDAGGDEEVNCGNMHYWSVPEIEEWQ